MPKVKANEIELNYEESGTGSEPLVLVHGWTGTLHNWDLLVEHLPLDRLRVFAFDLRGAGLSDRPPSGYEAWQLADDIADAAGNLGLDRFHYAGHSLGGFIGMQIGIRHSERLKRLMLVAPAPAGGTGVMGAGADEFYAAMSAVSGDLASHHDFVLQALSTRPVPAEFIEHLLKVEQMCSREHLDLVWAGLEEDISGRLPEIKAETLMIAGDRDFVFGSNLQDFARIPNCALHVFYRVNHMLSWEVPQELAGLMADFIENGVAQPAAATA